MASGYDNNLISNQAVGVSVAAGSAGALTTASLAPSNAALTVRLNCLTVSAGQVTTVCSGPLTITGLATAAGGTLNYIFVETVSAGGYVNLYFDPPLPASGANVSIVATLAAISGGSSAAITMTGSQA